MENKLEKTKGAWMDTVRRLRAMALLCRQTAAHHPNRSWKLLAEAEYWEHLADEPLPDRTEQCGAGCSLQSIEDPKVLPSEAATWQPERHGAIGHVQSALQAVENLGNERI
jgi:hypothetical protein